MNKQIILEKITSGIFIILFILVSNSILANSIEGTLKVYKNSDKKFSVQMSNFDEVKLAIRISDENERSLFEEEIKGNRNFNKTYDMSQLPQGNYFLEVEDNKKISEWKIQVSEKEMNISQISEISIPQFVQQNNRVELNLKNIANFDAKLKVIDENGIELYEEDLENTDSVRKIFDFSQVPPINYTIVASIGDRNFKFYVNE